MPPNDATLVQKTLAGDVSAFAELYRRRARLVVAYCHDATGDAHRAADLAHEVFLRAYERLSKLEQPERFAAWLLGFARQVVRESRRAQERYRRRLSEAPREAENGSEARRVRRVRNAVAVLGEEERIAVHAFYLEGHRIEHVMELLGLSRSAAYRLLDRARSRLREILCKLEVLP